MGITQSIDQAGIAEVVMNNPPVNALNVAGWFELARVIRELGENPEVRVVGSVAAAREVFKQLA